MSVELPKQEKKELEKINKIYFLIHPGYSTDDRNFPWLGRLVDKATIEKAAEEYAILGKKYVERAKQIKDDELMFAFSHGKNFKEDIKCGNYQYMDILKEMKNVLGRRLIVLSGQNDVIFDKNGEIFKVIKKIANSRGFDFNEEVSSEAYGEYLTQCVAKGAEILNTGGGLYRKTKINSKLTDHSVEKCDFDEINRMKSSRKRLKIR